TPYPGSRVSIKFVNPRGRYLPNQDEPRWIDSRGPQCRAPESPGVDSGQYNGGANNDGSYQPPTRNPGNLHIDLPAAQFTVYPANPTIVNSPMEHQELAAVYGAATATPAQAIPSWATNIGAPALRGSQV